MLAVATALMPFVMGVAFVALVLALLSRNRVVIAVAVALVAVNVVGLSLPLLRRLVGELGVRWTDLWNAVGHGTQ